MGLSLMRFALWTLSAALLLAIAFWSEELYRNLELEKGEKEAASTAVRMAFVIERLPSVQEGGLYVKLAVSYEYKRPMLHGEKGIYMPQGVLVPGQDYPYFEAVQEDIVRYLLGYPTKQDFYEVVLQNLAQYVLASYPQILWVKLTISIPEDPKTKLIPYNVTVIEHAPISAN